MWLVLLFTVAGAAVSTTNCTSCLVIANSTSCNAHRLACQANVGCNNTCLVPFENNTGFDALLCAELPGWLSYRIGCICNSVVNCTSECEAFCVFPAENHQLSTGIIILAGFLSFFLVCVVIILIAAFYQKPPVPVGERY
jgi:hypothetical protein